MKHSTRRHEALNDMLTDAQLLLLVREGDDEAFGLLYRRHLDVARAAARALLAWGPEAEDVVADAFTRMLSILQRGGGPEEAFRPYLLTCVRHACYDRSQGVARSLPVDPGDMADLARACGRGELDPQDSSSDSDLLARAFASLPERWQLVLWSTEVDGRRPADLAKELGLAPGAVASLAYRAREGLTEAFLSAHLQRPTAPACAAIRARLAAFVRDNVSGREEASIQAHLDECEECQGLVTELRELNRPLRGLLVPAVVGVPAGALLAEAATGAAGLMPRLLQFLHQRPVFGGAAAASVALLAGATLTGMAPLQPAETPAPAQTAASAAVVASGSGAVDGSGGTGTVSRPPGADPGVPPPLAPGGPGAPAVPAGPGGPAGPAGPEVPGGNPAAVTSPGVPGAGLTGPAITVSSGSLPPVAVPSESLPPISLPSVTLPSASVPAASLPPVSLPPVSVPSVSVSPVSVPTVSVPSVSVPLEVPSLPTVTAPVIAVPVITAPPGVVPDVSVVTVPVVTVPVTVPVMTVPPITVRGVTEPAVTVPPITTPALPTTSR